MVMAASATEKFSHKDKQLFSNMLVSTHTVILHLYQQCYDEKRYKEALKKVEILLENYATHAGKALACQTEIVNPNILECLSFKALIYNAIGKEKEAMQMMKVTIFKNMTNATCWHIYGLIHRKAK